MALLFDLVFLGSFFLGSFLLVVRLFFETVPISVAGLLQFLGSTLIFSTLGPVLLTAAYFIVLHSCGGQTIGKIFMGIRVVQEDGLYPSPGRSFLRLVGYLVSALPLGAGFLWAVLDKRHEAWHDKLVRTRVINL